MNGQQLTKEKFEEEFWVLVRAGYGYMKAYELLEERHLKDFGSYRYASYYSFANIRDKKNR